VAHVFAGFSQQTGKLIGLGALYIGFMLLAALLMVAMVFGMGDFSALTEMSQQGVVPTEADVWAAFGTGLWVAILLSSLVFMLLAMAFWLAPALVVFHDIGLMEALALSLKGLLVNWLALLVYGVFTMLLSIIAIIPLGLGLLILGPVMLASVYASYLDIFNLDNAR
jgi:uncharacterized membrane protein